MATVEDLLQGHIDVVHLADLHRMAAGSTRILLAGLGHNIRQRIDDVTELIAGTGMDVGGVGFCCRIRYRRLRQASGNEQRERREGDHRRDS